MTLPVVKKGIINASIATAKSEDPDEFIIKVITHMKKNNPVLFTMWQTSYTMVEKGKWSQELAGGYRQGFGQVYWLLNMQDECDELSDV